MVNMSCLDNGERLLQFLKDLFLFYLSSEGRIIFLLYFGWINLTFLLCFLLLILANLFELHMLF